MKRLVSIALLLLAPITMLPAQNRWSGSATLNIGSNFRNENRDLITDELIGKNSNSNGEAKFNVRYKAPKFEIKADFDGTKSYLFTTLDATSYVMSGTNEDDEMMELNFDTTQTEKEKGTVNGSISAIFTPNGADKVTVGIANHNWFESPLTQVSGFSLSEMFSLKYSYEETTRRKYDLRPTAEWLHRFDSGSELLVKASWLYADDNRYTEWYIGKANEENVNEKDYRLTPNYIDSDVNASAEFKTRDFRGIKGLNLDLSLMCKFKRDFDHYSAANYIDDAWVDSTRFRENFDYLSMAIEPKVHVSYDPGPFKVEVSAIPQYFTDRLNNDSLKERFDGGQIGLILDAGAWWRPSGHHSVGMKFGRKITRPDYLQMCWFRRPGSYINELQQGNADLKPTISNKMTAEYEFRSGRFSTKLELSEEYVKDKIERTFNMVDIDGVSTRIYTWINAGKSNTSNATLKLKWDGKKLKAGLNSGLNYFVGETANGTRTDNCDYKVDGDVTYDIVGGLRILGRLRYQSKVIRSYTTITEYVGCDLKISKTFWNKLDLFLEGRDLFDKPIQVITISEDETRGRLEESYLNRRLFVLGAKFTF